MPNLLIMLVAAKVSTDPDMSGLIESSEENRNLVRSRLRELLQKEQESKDREPSLRRFIGHHLGWIHKQSDSRSKSRSGWPFPSLYKRGRRFSWDEKMRNEDEEWLDNYAAYV